MTKTTDPWQRLLESQDLFSDLCDLYPPEFYTSFAKHFNRNPHPLALVKGVHNTAKAYVTGKWRKRTDNSKLLMYSGVHLVGAGLSARRLAHELRQVGKSNLAAAVVTIGMRDRFGDDRPFGGAINATIWKQLGPEARLTAIEQLCQSLEEAISSFIALPEDPKEEREVRKCALDFAGDFNRKRRKELSKNHPMESAAKAFRPVWEEFSTVKYARGRYKHELGGYDCPAGDALHAVVSRLDSTIAPSLAGTAIENVRTRPMREYRSD